MIFGGFDESLSAMNTPPVTLRPSDDRLTLHASRMPLGTGIAKSNLRRARGSMSSARTPLPLYGGCVRGCCGVAVTTLPGDGHGFFVDTAARGRASGAKT